MTNYFVYNAKNFFSMKVEEGYERTDIRYVPEIRPYLEIKFEQNNGDMTECKQYFDTFNEAQDEFIRIIKSLEKNNINLIIPKALKTS